MSISPITRCLNATWKACANADPWTKTAFVAGVMFLTIRQLWVNRQPTSRPPQPPPPRPQASQPAENGPTGQVLPAVGSNPLKEISNLAQRYVGIPDLNEEGAANLILEAIKGELEIRESAKSWGTAFSARLRLAEAFLDLPTCSLEQTKQIHDTIQRLWKERDPKHELQPFDFQEGCTADDLATAKLLVKGAIEQICAPLPPSSQPAPTSLGGLRSAHHQGEKPPLADNKLAEWIAKGHIQEAPSDQTRALRLTLLRQLLQQKEIPLKTLQDYDMAFQEIQAKDAPDFSATVPDIKPEGIALKMFQLSEAIDQLLGKTPLDSSLKVTSRPWTDPNVKIEREETRQAKAMLGVELGKIQKKLGEAENKGDCLFHAIGQQLNPPKAIKELRQLVADEVNAHPEKYQKFFYKEGTQEVDTQAFEEYKQKISLTNEESSPPIWGRSELDGAILAEKLGFQLRVYEVPSKEDRESAEITDPYLVTSVGGEAETVVEIANFSQHFMPILPLSE